MNRSRRDVESLLWRHPEWWSMALSAAAWIVLLSGGFGSQLARPAGLELIRVWLLDTVAWLFMVVAMMVPLVLYSVRLTAVRSLWQRRHRAIAGFLVGYLSPWLLLGAALAALSITVGLDHWLHALPWLGGAGFAMAATWQLAPVRRRALLACHRTMPLAPRGWRADRDCLRFGWQTGGQCLLSCWALMAACVLAGHSVVVMVCAAAPNVISC